MTKTRTRKKTRVWSVPILGLIGGLALFGPTLSASAAAPASATGSATAAATSASSLTGLTVTSNSVVVTARVPYNGNPATVTVSWGDGVTSPGALGVPSGSFLVFSHTYTPPANGSAFVRTLTATSNTGSVDRNVLITPRYAVTQSEQLFSPLTLCDSIFETETEWDVEEIVHRGATDGPEISSQQWEFDLNTGNVSPPAPTFYPLAGSSHYYEMTMADPSLYIAYDIAEIDLFLDDTFMYNALELHPRLGSYDGSTIYRQFAGDCEAELDADVTVTLLTPPPPPEPVNVPHVPPPSPPTSPPTPPRCNGNPRNCQEP